METHESAENYLETILILRQKHGNVRSIDVANELGYSKPSVSVAIKKLRENGFLEVGDTGALTLTKKGNEVAEQMYERHRCLTDFFVALGVDEETAATDACKIEHIISDETFAAIKKLKEQ